MLSHDLIVYYFMGKIKEYKWGVRFYYYFGTQNIIIPSKKISANNKNINNINTKKMAFIID